MERILSDMPTGKGIKATRIMEINPRHAIIARAKDMLGSDDEKLTKLTRVLYGEALLLAGLEISDGAEFCGDINDLI